MVSNLGTVKLWNEIITTFKIEERHLTRPDETFVFNALINYLKQFDLYDICAMINKEKSEDPEERRLFLVRFCYYIDSYYKISDKTNCFLYYDLLHPSPKKTAHVLNHLLNYLVFFQMVKSEVFNVAEKKIKTIGDLNQQIQTIKNDNEAKKIKIPMIEKTIYDCERDLVELDAKIDALNLENECQEEEQKQIQLELKREQATLDLLKAKKATSKQKVISEDEVICLIKKKEDVQAFIQQQTELEETIQASNQERTAKIDNLQPIMEKIENVLEVYTINNVVSFNESKKKANELKHKLSMEHEKQKQYADNIEKKEFEIKNASKALNLAKVQLEETKLANESAINKQKSLRKIETDLSIDLEKRLVEANTQLSAETETREYILSMTQLIVNDINEACRM